MKTLSPFLLVTIFSGIILLSCTHNTEIAALNARIAAINDSCTAFKNFIQIKESKIDSIKQQIAAYQQALDEDSTFMETYLLHHKMAVACILAGSEGMEPAINLRDEYSKHAQHLGMAAEIFSLTWYLLNTPEVDSVANKCRENTARDKRYYAAINNHYSQIAELRAKIDDDNAELTLLYNKITTINNQIAEVKKRIF